MKLRPFAEKREKEIIGEEETIGRNANEDNRTKVKRNLICVSWEDNHFRKII